MHPVLGEVQRAVRARHPDQPFGRHVDLPERRAGARLDDRAVHRIERLGGRVEKRDAAPPLEARLGEMAQHLGRGDDDIGRERLERCAPPIGPERDVDEAYVEPPRASRRVERARAGQHDGDPMGRAPEAGQRLGEDRAQPAEALGLGDDVGAAIAARPRRGTDMPRAGASAPVGDAERGPGVEPGPVVALERAHQHRLVDDGQRIEGRAGRVVGMGGNARQVALHPAPQPCAGNPLQRRASAEPQGVGPRSRVGGKRMAKEPRRLTHGTARARNGSRRRSARGARR